MKENALETDAFSMEKATAIHQKHIASHKQSVSREINNSGKNLSVSEERSHCQQGQESQSAGKAISQQGKQSQSAGKVHSQQGKQSQSARGNNHSQEKLSQSTEKTITVSEGSYRNHSRKSCHSQ